MKKESLFTKGVELDLSRIQPSRIQVLHDFGRIGRHVWLKRDDELSGTISAGKLRKYASLLSAIQKGSHDLVILEGGANSNHLLAAAQILLEAGIQPIPLVKLGHHFGSNAHLLELLVPRTEWMELDAKQWEDRSHFLQQAILHWKTLGKQPYYVPEGAFMSEALPGSTLLAEEIISQSAALGLGFQHIFIDAGTCLSAFGLAVGLAEKHWQGQLHVVSMAANEEEFESRWVTFKSWLSKTQLELAESAKDSMLFHRPSTAASFGAQNASVRQAVLDYARRYGILCDPIYAAKLLLTAEQWVCDNHGEENVLLIHSGGTSALPGFLPFS